MMNDRALWWRAKPYIVDWNKFIENGLTVEGRESFRCDPDYSWNCDDPLPDLVEPCERLIEKASKQRWIQVEYSNLREVPKIYRDYSDFESGQSVDYYSIWKSLDSPSKLYVCAISDVEIIGLDTKETVLITGVEGAHPVIVAKDFIYLNSDGSGPSLGIVRMHEGTEKIDLKRKQLTLEETKAYIGEINLDFIWETFRKYTKEFLANEYH